MDLCKRGLIQIAHQFDENFLGAKIKAAFQFESSTIPEPEDRYYGTCFELSIDNTSLFFVINFDYYGNCKGGGRIQIAQYTAIELNEYSSQITDETKTELEDLLANPKWVRAMRINPSSQP